MSQYSEMHLWMMYNLIAIVPDYFKDDKFDQLGARGLYESTEALKDGLIDTLLGY